MPAPQDQPPVSHDSGKKAALFGIIALIIVGVVGFLIWNMTKDYAEAPTISPTATPTIDQDTRNDLRALEEVDTSDLDAEFQEIDQDLNQL